MDDHTAPHYDRSGIRTRISGWYDRIVPFIEQRFPNGDALLHTVQRSVPPVAASMVIGIVSVLYAKFFLMSEHVGRQIFDAHPLLFLFLSPLLFLLSWSIVRFTAPFARGSGIPQVLGALEVSGAGSDERLDRLLGFRVAVAKVASSLALALGGGAIGREGPTIQIAASIARGFRSLLPDSWPKASERTMIITGSAAGLAAAFNTPLGGIVFAIEELSRSHFTAVRTTLLTSVIVAGLVAQMLMGPYLYLGYPWVPSLTPPLFIVSIITAVAAGVVGTGFSASARMLLAVRNRRQGWWPQALFTAACSLMMAGFAWWFSPVVLGSGKDMMVGMLFGQSSGTPGMDVAGRFIGPLASFTSGGAGGIFAPSFSIGAALGKWASVIAGFTPDQGNMVILAGMAAFLTAVTRSPFTSSILVLEMTDRHAMVFVLMVASLISYLVAWSMDRHSLYEHLKTSYLREAGSDPGITVRTTASDSVEGNPSAPSPGTPPPPHGTPPA